MTDLFQEEIDFLPLRKEEKLSQIRFAEEASENALTEANQECEEVAQRVRRKLIDFLMIGENNMDESVLKELKEGNKILENVGDIEEFTSFDSNF